MFSYKKNDKNYFVDVEKEISRTRESIIYKAKWGTDSNPTTDCALKMVISDYSVFEHKYLEVLKDVKGVVRMYDYFYSYPIKIIPGYEMRQRLHLILEYLPGGTLEERKDFLTPTRIKQIIRHVCLTLKQVHELGIIHRDLKPSNIMFRQGLPVLIDLGLASFSKDMSCKALGTPYYVSPETLRKYVVTPATDLWSLGVLLFELLTGQMPFDSSDDENNQEEVSHKIMSLSYDPSLVKDPHARELVCSLLTNRPNRATINEVLESCFLYELPFLEELVKRTSQIKIILDNYDVEHSLKIKHADFLLMKGICEKYWTIM